MFFNDVGTLENVVATLESCQSAHEMALRQTGDATMPEEHALVKAHVRNLVVTICEFSLIAKLNDAAVLDKRKAVQHLVRRLRKTGASEEAVLQLVLHAELHKLFTSGK